MVSVLIECKDQERALAQTLAALVPGAVEGLVREVIVIDRGSHDGTARVADAAGCHFLRNPEIKDVVRAARSEWLFMVEPGAQPVDGWIEQFERYIGKGHMPARLRMSRMHKPSFFQRIGRRASPLQCGLLMPKRHAMGNVRSGQTLEDLGRGLATRKLDCAIIPA